MNANKKHACIVVKSCLNNEFIEPLNQYFELSNHGKNTRNNEKMIRLPRIRTEYARKAFYYIGAKLFNSLPLKARSLQNTCEFKNFVSDLFK